MEFKATNLSDLDLIAKEILASTSNRIFLFKGEMGAGKTTLIKKICFEMQCEDDISSPTFSIVNHYVSPNYGDVFHFDFYRINSIEEAMDIGFEEYLDSGAYCLIEWPERIMKLISDTFVEVEINVKAQSRLINVHL